MGRMSKNIGFTVPPRMADDFDRVAKEEGSTKSELFRRMFRLYQTYRTQFDQAEEIRLDRLVERAIEEANRPLSAEETRREEEEDERLLRSGAYRAEQAGIQEEDIDQIVYAKRKEWNRRA